MTTSEQLETDAEATRARITATLDELRSRMTPGQLVDQMVDYTRNGPGGAFFRNLGRQVANNPLPVALAGAGLAWLMMANRQPAASASDDVAAGMSQAGARREGGASATGGRLSDTAGQWADEAGRVANDWAGRTKSRVSELGAYAGEAGSRLQAAAGSAADTASSAYGTAADTSRRTADAISRTAGNVRQNAAAVSHDVTDFFTQQPLVLAGIGLALGAILGAALPATETEDQLMGDLAEDAKRQARDLANEQIDKGKAAAKQALSGAKGEFEHQADDRGDAASGHSRAEVESSLASASRPGHDAPLVPSDESGRAEASGNEPHGELERAK